MDCFATLAMTLFGWYGLIEAEPAALFGWYGLIEAEPAALFGWYGLIEAEPAARHCEERSDEAIQYCFEEYIADLSERIDIDVKEN